MNLNYDFKNSNHTETFKKHFYEMLTKIINETIIPNFGDKLYFNIDCGLWTSDEYGSYRIPFYTKENVEVCYIIADTITGKWEIFKKQIEKL